VLDGDDKSYDMARSLLPSTGRKAAREARASVSRSHRHVRRGRMARLMRAPEAADDDADLRDDSHREMRYVVDRRRDKDKVNPFRRWARAVTADLPRDQRLEHVRGLLPRGVIGEHALSHLSWDAHFIPSGELEYRQSLQRAHRARRRDEFLDPGLQAQLLRHLLRLPGGQRAFNDHLKRACATHCTRQRGHDGRWHMVWHGRGTPRLLLGLHDVRPFLDSLRDYRWNETPPEHARSVPEALQAARDFLCELHRQRGDLAATLAALSQRPLPRAPGARPRGMGLSLRS
jgi:hypothetical protein